LPPMPPGAGGPPMPPPGPMGPPPGAGGPPGMPPGMPPKPPMGPPIGRKAGGRVNDQSYASLKGGAGSGLGRLRKQGLRVPSP